MPRPHLLQDHVVRRVPEVQLRDAAQLRHQRPHQLPLPRAVQLLAGVGPQLDRARRARGEGEEELVHAAVELRVPHVPALAAVPRVARAHGRQRGGHHAQPPQHALHVLQLRGGRVRADVGPLLQEAERVGQQEAAPVRGVEQPPGGGQHPAVLRPGDPPPPRPRVGVEAVQHRGPHAARQTQQPGPRSRLFCSPHRRSDNNMGLHYKNILLKIFYEAENELNYIVNTNLSDSNKRSQMP